MAPRIKTSVLRSQLSKAGYLTGTALAGLGLSFGRNKPVSEAATPDEDLITSSIEETPEAAAHREDAGQPAGTEDHQGGNEMKFARGVLKTSYPGEPGVNKSHREPPAPLQ